MEIARLLDERDRIQFTPDELTGNRKALRRAILILWQTNMLRSTRLKVLDEVANGLSFYDHTFLRELPRFYADLEDQLGAIEPKPDRLMKVPKQLLSVSRPSRPRQTARKPSPPLLPGSQTLSATSRLAKKWLLPEPRPPWTPS